MIIEFDMYSGNKAILKCPKLLDLIREKLSVANKDARFIKKQTGYGVSRLYCITKTGRFEIGLFNEIKKVIDALGIHVEYRYSKEFMDACVPQFECYDNELSTLSLTPYDYQEESVKRMLKFGRGCILIGTGGGKTLIMSLLIKSLKDYLPHASKFLIIVPTIQLVEQTYSDFIDYGYDPSTISRWSGDYDFYDTDIIVASSSIIQSKSSDLSFLSKLDVLVVDEVHILKKSNKISKIIDKIPTYNRFGFTGTMPEDIIDQWNIIGKIGPILFNKSSDELRNDKVIADAKIDIIKIDYNLESIRDLHARLDSNHKKYIAELEFIVEHEYRNSLIVHTAMVSKGNTLIMVDRIKHGEIIRDMLTEKAKNKKIYFIQGDVGIDERERVRDIMENEDDIICVAISKIFSTGINIKNIHNIVFATPGKAKVKLIQSIGRGLRLHKRKVILKIFDFADNLHYSNRHLAKREILYLSEKLNYEIKYIKQST